MDNMQGSLLLKDIVKKVTTKSLPYKLISIVGTNANVVKGSESYLHSIVAIGTTANIRYLKLYNKATAPIVGTDVPVMTLPIPGNTNGAGLAISFSASIFFPKGLSLAITSGASDSDNTNIGAGDVVVNITYS